MTLFRNILLVLLITASAFRSYAQEDDGGRPPPRNSVVATVDGTPITLVDILMISAHGEYQLREAYSGKELDDRIAALRAKCLEEIISKKLIYQEFKSRECRIPKQVVEEMVDGAAKDMAGGSREELERMLTSMGSSLEELRGNAHEFAAVNIFVNEICYRSLSVSPREVAEYYKANPGKFTDQVQIELQLLMVRRGEGESEMEFEKRLQDLFGKTEGADETVF